jgi:transposase
MADAGALAAAAMQVRPALRHHRPFHFCTDKNLPMLPAQLFEAALGLSKPWYVTTIDFDQKQRTLTIGIDFEAGARFAASDVAGQHPVHDTQIKRYRHLNFFQHECMLEVRVPRVKLPDGRVVLVEPGWAGKLSGFTLLFEALIFLMCQQMPFAAVARIVNVSAYRVQALCKKYVGLAEAQADLSDLSALAIDETSYRRGHRYATLAADAAAEPDKRRVVFVTEGREAAAIERLAKHLTERGAFPEQIVEASIDMSPAFIAGVTEHLPNARITFDKFHVVAHASSAIDKTRRAEQKTDPSLKGMRWLLLKDTAKLNNEQLAALQTLLAQVETKRTARAWQQREQLRQILDCRQPNVMERALRRWCTHVMRSRVEPMKEVVRMIRNHFDGIVAWARSRQTNGFLEALNGLFQAAKRRARGYVRFDTIRTVIFLIAGKLDYSKVNPHAVQPT